MTQLKMSSQDSNFANTCMLNLAHAHFFPVQEPKSLHNSNTALERGT